METEKIKKRSWFDRVLDKVEKIGNKLPDPNTMFLALIVIVVIVSAICSALNVQVVNPATNETVKAFNLLSAGGIQYLWNNVITNYSGFAPLAMVLVALIGTSVAEKSGLMIALMERFLGKAKGWVVTAVIIFLGINLNVAGDSGFIILPALAAILYMSIGRNPMLGLYVAFASVAGGFCANMFLGMSDALAYGFTESAAQMIDPDYSGTMAINWYFLMVSCVLLTIGGTILVEKVLMRRYLVTKEELREKYSYVESENGISDIEKKGLRNAGIGLLIYALFIVFLSAAPICNGEAVLADSTGSLLNSSAPFSKGIVFMVTLALLIPGIIYGVTTGRYKNEKDVWKDINEGFSGMAGYIFMCFFISIFVNFFSTSKLGTIIAVSSANGLEHIGLTGIPLMICLLLVCALVNIFMGSASAKWAILAPIFVPMMMMLGYGPAMTQILYRIGDSITNPISPLFSYMPVILGYARKYEKDAGVGTIIAGMIPFSVTFALIWILQVIVWVVFNLPLGPGGTIGL